MAALVPVLVGEGQRARGGLVLDLDAVDRDGVARRRVGGELGERLVGSLGRVVEERGFQLIVLLRLSPIVPYGLLNYALGLTRVSTRSYFLAGALGMLPGTLLYVYLGAAVTNVGALMAGRSAFPTIAAPWLDALYWGGLVATVAMVVWVSWVSHAAVRDALASAKRGDPASP